MAVDRKVAPAEGLTDVRIFDKFPAIDREIVFSHAEAPAARNIELPGERPQNHCGANRLYAAFAVFETCVHDRGCAVRFGYAPCERYHCFSRDARDALDYFGPEMPNIHGELIESAGPIPYEGVVIEFLFDEDIAYA